MIIYYSGEGTKSNPEVILAEKANVMLTFIDHVKNGPNTRFKKIIQARKDELDKKLAQRK